MAYEDAFIRDWFNSAAARAGGVIRRDRYYVDQLSNFKRVVTAARDRSWHVIENGGQVIVLCNDAEVKIHA